MSLKNCYNFEDYRKLAKKKLPAPIFHYIDGGADDEVTLKRNTNLNDVGGAALFLLSNLSSGTTGEILHVDSGYHVVGMKSPDAPDISVV